MFRQIFASAFVIACMSAQGAAIHMQASANLNAADVKLVEEAPVKPSRNLPLGYRQDREKHGPDGWLAMEAAADKEIKEKARLAKMGPKVRAIVEKL